MTPRRRWLLVAPVAGVILVASLLPAGGGPTPTLLGVGLDKWQHLGGYAVLAVALGYALRAGDRPRVEGLVLAFTVTVGYGNEGGRVETVIIEGGEETMERVERDA